MNGCTTSMSVTLSNISKSLALGWWMVQMMVLPPCASDFIRDTTWKQEALSRPLTQEDNRHISQEMHVGTNTKGHLTHIDQEAHRLS